MSKTFDVSDHNPQKYAGRAIKGWIGGWPTVQWLEDNNYKVPSGYSPLKEFEKRNPKPKASAPRLPPALPSEKQLKSVGSKQLQSKEDAAKNGRRPEPEHQPSSFLGKIKKYVKDNKLASRAARAIGFESAAQFAEKHGYSRRRRARRAKPKRLVPKGHLRETLMIPMKIQAPQIGGRRLMSQIGYGEGSQFNLH